MGINSLYKYAEDHHIDIDYFPLSATKSLSIPGGIALNPNELKTHIDTKECLAHELGHQATGSFYKVNSKFETRSRMEEQATRWAVQKLVNAQDLKNALKNGYAELWQLAEYFDVSIEFMKDAIRVHKAEGAI